VSYCHATTSTLQYKKSANFIQWFCNLQAANFTCNLLVLYSSRWRLVSHNSHTTKLVSFPNHLKTTLCDTLKTKIMNFLFNRRFYEFYLWKRTPNLVLRIVLFSPSSLAAFILTPWCRVLLEKLTALQLVKKFPAFHGTRRFITALTSVRHPSLSWASPIQSIYPHVPYKDS